MNIRRIATALVATACTAATVATAVPAQAATATGAPRTGTTSLATVLAADGNRFDRNWRDFDIVDRAVTTVLQAKPDSAVAVLAGGAEPVTAFLPTDRAFRVLVEDLTGRHLARERAVFRAVAHGFDVDTIEAVLLYHVVPGRPSPTPRPGAPTAPACRPPSRTPRCGCSGRRPGPAA